MWLVNYVYASVFSYPLFSNGFKNISYTVENDDVKEGSEILYSLNIGQLSNIFLLLQN